MCRSRRELSNEYLLAKFGFDTAENEPCKVCPLSAYGSPRFFLYFKNPDVVDTSELGPEEIKVFSSFGWSLTTTYKMLLGDYHDEDVLR